MNSRFVRKELNTASSSWKYGSHEWSINLNVNPPQIFIWNRIHYISLLKHHGITIKFQSFLANRRFSCLYKRSCDSTFATKQTHRICFKIILHIRNVRSIRGQNNAEVFLSNPTHSYFNCLCLISYCRISVLVLTKLLCYIEWRYKCVCHIPVLYSPSWFKPVPLPTNDLSLW